MSNQDYIIFDFQKLKLATGLKEVPIEGVGRIRLYNPKPIMSLEVHQYVGVSRLIQGHCLRFNSLKGTATELDLELDRPITKLEFNFDYWVDQALCRVVYSDGTKELLVSHEQIFSHTAPSGLKITNAQLVAYGPEMLFDNFKFYF